MYLDRKFGLNLSLSEITLLFDLSLYLDRTLAQRKAKSKVKVTQYLFTRDVKFWSICQQRLIYIVTIVTACVTKKPG